MGVTRSGRKIGFFILFYWVIFGPVIGLEIIGFVTIIIVLIV